MCLQSLWDANLCSFGSNTGNGTTGNLEKMGTVFKKGCGIPLAVPRSPAQSVSLSGFGRNRQTEKPKPERDGWEPIHPPLLSGVPSYGYSTSKKPPAETLLWNLQVVRK